MLDVKSTLELRTKDFPLSCTNQPRKRKRRNRDGFESLEYHQQPFENSTTIQFTQLFRIAKNLPFWVSNFPKAFILKIYPETNLKRSETSPNTTNFFMMKTKQARNQNHPLPERSSQFTQTAFPHKQGKNISDVEHLGARNPKWRKDITRSS